MESLRFEVFQVVSVYSLWLLERLIRWRRETWIFVFSDNNSKWLFKHLTKSPIPLFAAHPWKLAWWVGFWFLAWKFRLQSYSSTLDTDLWLTIDVLWVLAGDVQGSGAFVAKAVFVNSGFSAEIGCVFWCLRMKISNSLLIFQLKLAVSEECESSL